MPSPDSAVPKEPVDNRPNEIITKGGSLPPFCALERKFAMKIGKLLMAAGLMMSVLLSGCQIEEMLEQVDNSPINKLTEPKQTSEVKEPIIGFAKTEVDSPDELDQVKLQDLENYTSEYGAYNTYTYYEHLNQPEKLLYHAYEYALDEAQSCFWIDERLLDGMERTSAEVLEFFSLDSAMVGQNYEHREGEATLSLPDGDDETETESYLVVMVDNFERAELRRKKEAIEKAEQIVSEMPETATQQEAAEYFYDYLGNNITYETDIEGREYLYTALCEQRTNCDGYTNAFALLCSMADIPCIEIISDTPMGEIGHTWNMICLDGQWVHVDCTVSRGDVTSKCKNCREERPYFGFSDELLVYPILHEEIVPDSPEGLSSVLNVSSGKTKNFISKVEAEFEDNDRKFAVVLVDQGDLENKIEDLVEALDVSLYYMHYETAQGKTVYYLFSND